jgi:hypothetical protein
VTQCAGRRVRATLLRQPYRRQRVAGTQSLSSHRTTDTHTHTQHARARNQQRTTAAINY